MANWYVSSVDYTAVAQFAINHAYIIGNIVRQLATPTVGNERCFRCTTAGTSGGTEAAWTLTKGSTTTQGTAVFTEITGNETYQSPGAWAAPFARIRSAGTSGWCAAGDTIYVAANNDETSSAAVSWAIPTTTATATQTSIICVDQSGTGHVPPTAGDTRTTAKFTTTGNSAFDVTAGNLYCYGIIFNLQSGGNNNQAHSLNGQSLQKYEACAFNLLSSANSSLTISASTGGSIEWVNTTLQYGNAAVVFNVKGGFIWRDTPSAFSGSAPTSGGAVFIVDAAMCRILIDGVDLSGVGAVKLITFSNVGSRALVTNCKRSSSEVAPTLAGAAGFDTRIDYINSDSGGSTVRCESYSSELSLTTETTVVRTGGASDGATTYSWKCATTSNVKWALPGICFPIMAWNALTGSARTVAVEALFNGAAILNNDQLWIDVHHLGTASSTLASSATSSKANILASATALTASTQAWDSAVTARANSHAYVVGDTIKTTSNSGRVFFCTVNGTSASSEPGGYAGAVDGGTVTDGGATFRAGWRMTISVSVTPQMAGLIRATPKVGVASATLYIDPKLSIT